MQYSCAFRKYKYSNMEKNDNFPEYHSDQLTKYGQIEMNETKLEHRIEFEHQKLNVVLSSILMSIVPYLFFHAWKHKSCTWHKSKFMSNDKIRHWKCVDIPIWQGEKSEQRHQTKITTSLLSLFHPRESRNNKGTLFFYPVLHLV